MQVIRLPPGDMNDCRSCRSGMCLPYLADLDHEVKIGNLSDVCNDAGSFAVASGTFRSSHTILVYDVYCCPQQA